MPEKFKNKYTVQSARLRGYDYSQSGMYFITICVKNREEFFGKIENEKIILSEIGEIIREELLKTPIVRQNVKLDEWVIMPNHLHAIIEIYNDRDALCRDALCRDALCRDALQCVSTGVIEYRNKFGPQKNNLASIIRGFKGATKNKIYQIDPVFTWQSRFYDHVIRNETALNKIREYVQTNPQMWERDRNNVENLWI